ncbi:hypothetical protein FACS189443_6100 [Planctomycetales bacterium]|nr:hypothetical protein FACS189443_6100 [Planctomycetales bacterium]
MLAVLRVAYQERHQKGGRRPKLSVGGQLFLTLQYWREYRTMSHLAFDFGVAKSTVSDTILLVENALIQNGTFHLPGKKALLSKENAGRTLAVDVTESPMECPKKTEKMVFREEKTAYNAGKPDVSIPSISRRTSRTKLSASV